MAGKKQRDRLQTRGRDNAVHDFGRLWMCAVLAGFFLSSVAAHAGGVVHGARAAGMGTAFNAVADDPSAILFNPAGLTQSTGTAVYGGVTLVAPETTYTGLSGASERTDSGVFFPPHLYLVSGTGTEDVVIGLGLYSPFGIGGRAWSGTGLTRYYSTESSIATFSVNPTVAWRVFPALSLGFGIDYLRAEIEMEQMIDQSAFGAGDAATRLDAEGDGWGYNIGALILLGRDLRLAFAYRSRIRVDLDGDIALSGIAPFLQPLFGSSHYSSRVSAVNRFPDIWSVGIAYAPRPALIVAADAELLRWSSFDRMVLDVAQEVPAAGFGDSVAMLDWQDPWQIKVGIEYRATGALSLRAGYAYIETFVPDHTLEPGNPDADQHNVSIGAGYRSGAWWFDGFYNAGFFRDRAVQNTILSGTYENFIHYAGVSIGRSF